ncbi:MAG: SPOR domain-containing protein [Rikenellaceae bacterium]
MFSFSLNAECEIVTLKSNADYEALIKQSEKINESEKQISEQLKTLREEYSNPDSDKSSVATQILALEDKLFALRNSKGELQRKITSLEQEYLLQNLSKQKQVKNQEADSITFTEQSIDITKNQALVSALSADDYKALVSSNKREVSITNYIRIFMSNYKSLKNISEQYKTVKKQASADSLYNKYLMLSKLNDKISDSVEVIWNDLYYQKAYAYSYIFDKNNRIDLIENHQNRALTAQNFMSENLGIYASDIIAAYPKLKQSLLCTEIDLCELLELDKAKKAHENRKKSVDSLNYCLDKIIINIKNLIDYQDLKFGSMPYTKSHPVPQCPIYERGEIYRISVGNFSAQQQPSIFRKTTPIYYMREKNKTYTYYIGGFETLKQAEDAAKKLKQHGFRRPIIQKWLDSERVEIGKESTKHNEGIFRMEITLSDSELPDNVKQLINDTDKTLEITRIAQAEAKFTFIIGNFDSEKKAIELQEKISILHKAILPEIKKL